MRSRPSARSDDGAARRGDSRRGCVRASLPTLAAIAAIAICVAAGNWQKSRMQAKEALRAQYDDADRAAPVALRKPAGRHGLGNRCKYRAVTAAGEYLPHRDRF